MQKGFPCGSAIMWETWVQSMGWEDLLGRERLPIPALWPRESHGQSMFIQARIFNIHLQLIQVHFTITQYCFIGSTSTL